MTAAPGDEARAAAARPSRRWLRRGVLLLLLLQAGLVVLAVLTRGWFVDPAGRPYPTDFVAIWAAGALARAGEAAAAYDPVVLRAAMTAATGRDLPGLLPWNYPPVFLLLVAPLAALPVLLAWPLFLAATAGMLAWALRPVLGWLGGALVLAMPASFWCVLVGQNGFLSAGLLAGMLASLERRPWLAGLFLGALTYKPHLGLLVPVALLAGGHWRCTAGATATTLLLGAASLLAFGQAPWLALLDSGRAAVESMAEGRWEKHQSVQALALWATGVPALARMVQLAAALAVAGIVAWLWRRPGTRAALRGAALAAGSMLATPYLFIYDGVVLGVAAVLLLRDGLDRGMARREQALLAAACLLPVLYPVSGGALLQPAAAVMLGMAAWRAVAAGGALPRPA